MSTMLLIGRMPAFCRRCCSQRGDGATFSPSRAVMLNSPPASTATRSLAERGSGWLVAAISGAFIWVWPPTRAATSLAMPCIERPSGRLAVIANSKTWSSSPRLGPTAVPRGGTCSSSSSRMAIPSPSAVWPSSAREQIMPLLATPRSSAGLIVRFTAGRVAPTRATGTWMPARTFAAPQTICRVSAAPISTKQTLSLSALGWAWRSRTKPTTTPPAWAARSSMASTSKPAKDRRSASGPGARACSGPVTSSCSHWSETRIARGVLIVDLRDQPGGGTTARYGVNLSFRIAPAAQRPSWLKTRASGS